ncbi:hypothetical protein HYFRA_00013971 [Hymenoscyphus fraxineus]|uniref:UBA domain-containing protein n=1 Tax=Hymenoscyphus fraxineus TaxID=746836 RepID=A0A9N9L7Q5_9HELO|nr:hypothetical protein HYFRA_00013971 [Hymenoscyphus fraxineus]
MLSGSSANTEHRSAHIPIHLAVRVIKFGIDLYDALSPTEKARDPTEMLYRSLSGNLALHDISKKNEEQLVYVRRALQVAMSVLRREKKFTILDFEYTTKGLAVLGTTHFKDGRHLPQAKAAFLLLARLARACMTEDHIATINEGSYLLRIANSLTSLHAVTIRTGEPKEISDQYRNLIPKGPFVNMNPMIENPISEQATGWYSLAQGIDTGEISELLLKASIQYEVDQVDKAKKIYTDLLRRARQRDDKAAQFGCQRALVLLYIKMREWRTAGEHTKQAMSLTAFQGKTGSYWPGTNVDKGRDYLLFALSFMKVGKWESAFTAMQQATSIIVVSANSDDLAVLWKEREALDLEKLMHDWLTTDLNIPQEIKNLKSALEAAVSRYTAEEELERRMPIGTDLVPEVNLPQLEPMGALQQRAIAIGESMGFSRTQIDAAMRAAYSHPDRALEYLFNHTSEHCKFVNINKGIPEHLRRDSVEHIPVGSWKLDELLEAARASSGSKGVALHCFLDSYLGGCPGSDRKKICQRQGRDVQQSRAVIAIMNSPYILHITENAKIEPKPERFTEAIDLLLSSVDLSKKIDQNSQKRKDLSIADKVLKLMIPGYKPLRVEEGEADEEQKSVTFESSPKPRKRETEVVAIKKTSTINVMATMKAAFENGDETAIESAFTEGLKQMESTNLVDAIQAAFENRDKLAFESAYEEAKMAVRRAGKAPAR